MINIFNISNNTAGRIILTKTKAVIFGSVIVGALALPLMVPAGQPPAKESSRYKLIDLGTFGGPGSSFTRFSKIANNQGTVIGGADTAIPDPFDPNCFSPNCVVQHAFKWQDSVLIDLGALPGGGASSFAACINEPGQIVGLSQNGLIDPLTGAPETIAVLWGGNGEIINLGTLGGNQSFALAVVSDGQTVC